MTVASAVSALHDRLRALRETVEQLALAIDDAPATSEEPAVVSALRMHAAELESDVRDALDTAGAECQRAVNRAWSRLHAGFGSHDTILEMERIGRERGIGWQRWSAVVRENTERSEHEIHQTADALAACWCELGAAGGDPWQTAT